MSKVLLTLHVLAAILLVGPVTVAASLFPRHARAALAGWPSPDAGELGVLRALHRISRIYGMVAILVPLLGLYTAVSMKVMGDAWVLISVALTAVAAGVLGVAVVPRQSALMKALGGGPGAGDAGGAESPAAGDDPGGVPAPDAAAARRLAMLTGIFALLWTVVMVLMIARPGSSIGR